MADWLLMARKEQDDARLQPLEGKSSLMSVIRRRNANAGEPDKKIPALPARVTVSHLQREQHRPF